MTLGQLDLDAACLSILKIHDSFHSISSFMSVPAFAMS